MLASLVMVFVCKLLCESCMDKGEKRAGRRAVQIAGKRAD